MKLEIAPPAPTTIPAGVDVYVKAALKFETVAVPFDKQVEVKVLIVGISGGSNGQPMLKALEVAEQIILFETVIVYVVSHVKPEITPPAPTVIPEGVDV